MNYTLQIKSGKNVSSIVRWDLIVSVFRWYLRMWKYNTVTALNYITTWYSKMFLLRNLTYSIFYGWKGKVICWAEWCNSLGSRKKVFFKSYLLIICLLYFYSYWGTTWGDFYFTCPDEDKAIFHNLQRAQLKCDYIDLDGMKRRTKQCHRRLSRIFILNTVDVEFEQDKY